MILDSVPPNTSLGPVLHARAIATPVRRLALDVVLGSVAAGVALWFRPLGWIQLASGGLCFALYGVWAFAERHLETGARELTQGEELGWTVLRGAAAATGLIAAAVLAGSVAAAMLGTWIS